MPDHEIAGIIYLNINQKLSNLKSNEEPMLNNLRHFTLFLKDIYSSRGIILQLAKNDFKNRFVSSYLGIFWAFVQPLVMIVVLWFVFQVGFRAVPVEDTPFILFIACGLIPWFFFADSLTSATGSLLDYSYLVKKVVFRTSVLPLVKILSSLFVHLFFIGLLFALFFAYGYKPSLYYLQIFYYSFALLMFLMGLTWLTSSLIVFLKDVQQIIAIILQVGFWITPNFWHYSMVPERYHYLLKLNPMFYIVEGYRDTLIYNVWFWQRYNQTLYFWIITAILFIGGALLFRKLRPHFPDVL